MGATTQESKKAAEPAVNSDSDSTVIISDHLPPLPLCLIVLICSLGLLVFALRDFLTTGRNIGGSWDEAMLIFTKSTDWYNDSRGWRSTQGGFSAVMKISTDQNNMGGFFVRKVAGAAAVGVHLQKLIPLLLHPPGAQWVCGHFRPLLMVSLVGNVAIGLFYAVYWNVLSSNGATELPRVFLALLGLESITIAAYLLFSKSIRKGHAVAMPEGKTPNSWTSNIVSRTILISTTAVAVIALRDLFLPGFVLSFIPRDDIYLEWTNAFLHSPPPGSPEDFDQGLQAPLYIGDKFMSQFAALHLLILCLYKFTTAVWIRYGSDGSGTIKCKMIWKAQAFADGLLLFVLRIFQPAAVSASLDLRWHLMVVGYETFILFLYGFF
ncbi:hypothetical protein FisN_6Hh086 [Fistulifera solaris]|uniref:Uncharacterized protein n=1 Tax=Fistulifera solaris TaxID=1519565 RepID=A0A1Z5KI09_FISSO|nr:hypothetical protein FisN_6Hh086 [Fistulifera solaris]|eukprot:GAX25876.1 hypothetical protein FisN_6Hh086 [Fistulifera solaris]